MKTRIGFGFDVHKLVEGRELWLGGIRIEHTLGLLGHSDADVLIHALCDALLGAANMRDIGFHDLYYLNFAIDLLRKEIIYSVSLEEELGKRCCGTDYRLLLLQQLCKKKHLLETAAV